MHSEPTCKISRCARPPPRPNPTPDPRQPPGKNSSTFPPLFPSLSAIITPEREGHSPWGTAPISPRSSRPPTPRASPPQVPHARYRMLRIATTPTSPPLHIPGTENGTRQKTGRVRFSGHSLCCLSGHLAPRLSTWKTIPPGAMRAVRGHGGEGITVEMGEQLIAPVPFLLAVRR